MLFHTAVVPQGPHAPGERGLQVRGIAPLFASPLGLTTYLLLLSMLSLFDPPHLLSRVRSPLDDAYQDQDQHDDEE
jgi:hypothetical protein